MQKTIKLGIFDKKNKSVLKNFHLVYLHKILPESHFYVLDDELNIKIKNNDLTKFFFFLKNHSLCQYNTLVDLTSIDYIEKKDRFEINYFLLSFRFNTRINVIIALNEKTELDSIMKIFKSANWMEREVWDMYGIFFVGHSDFRRILTDYGFKGHPLLKIFPMSGFKEVCYNMVLKKIQYQNINLAQGYRVFSYSETITSLNFI